MFSRIVFGARISIEVGFGAVLVGTGLAAILGIISGYFGGLFDLLFQRFIDAWIAFPALVLLACLVTIMSTKKTSSTSSIIIVAVVLGLIVAGGSTRVVRSAVIGIRDMPYMESARCVGCNHTRIIFRYVLPNVLAPIIILATVQLGGAILAESTLSFLGFGVKPPMPAWGSMLATSGQQFFLRARHWRSGRGWRSASPSSASICSATRSAMCSTPACAVHANGVRPTEAHASFRQLMLLVRAAASSLPSLRAVPRVV